MRGLLGVEGEINRDRGAKEVFDKYPEIKIVADPVADWIQAKAKDRMTEVLRAQPKIDVVYGHNDPMAIGAYLAAKELGREKEMIFVGVDGLGGAAGGIKKVMDGVLAATFVYPLCVDKAVEIGRPDAARAGFQAGEGLRDRIGDGDAGKRGEAVPAVYGGRGDVSPQRKRSLIQRESLMSLDDFTRRHFFFGTLLAGAVPAGGFGSTPSLKALGYKSPNEKLNIASDRRGRQGAQATSPAARTREHRGAVRRGRQARRAHLQAVRKGAEVQRLPQDARQGRQEHRRGDRHHSRLTCTPPRRMWAWSAASTSTCRSR